MTTRDIFKTIVEPDLARLPVLEIVHREKTEGKEVTLAHIVRRNVFTEFDELLSRHLAATRGAGFPRISVETMLCDDEEHDQWHPIGQADHASVPAALLAIAEHAIQGEERAHLTIYQGQFARRDRNAEAFQREVQREDIAVVREALKLAQMFGEADFVEIAGDFDMITLRPAGAEMAAVTVDLYNRMVSVPVSKGRTSDRLDAPLFDFGRFVSTSFEARAFMASAQRALIGEKEAAVSAFRNAADEAILRFEEALKGRMLTGHRLDAVVALVARLKAGLGEALNGLSADALITALDWSGATAASGEQARSVETGSADPRDWVRAKGATVN